MPGKRFRPQQGSRSDDSETESFVVYGLELDSKENQHSYAPVHKQNALDDKGLKRFHGAFTGGFSAGYYNTVGSKEGWTPSAFVSSRTNRAKYSSQKIEDFMDAEDQHEIQENKRLVAIKSTNALSISYQLEGNSSFKDYTKPNEHTRPILASDILTLGDLLLRKFGFKTKKRGKVGDTLKIGTYQNDYQVINQHGLGYGDNHLKDIGYNNLEKINKEFLKRNNNMRKPETITSGIDVPKTNSQTEKSSARHRKKLKSSSAKSNISRLSFGLDEDSIDPATFNMPIKKPLKSSNKSLQDKNPNLGAFQNKAPKSSMRPSQDAVNLATVHFSTEASKQPENQKTTDEKLLWVEPDQYVQKLACLDGKPPIKGFTIIENVTNNIVTFSKHILNVSSNDVVPKEFDRIHASKNESILISYIPSEITPNMPAFKNSKNTEYTSKVSENSVNNVDFSNNLHQSHVQSSLLTMLADLSKIEAQGALKGYIPFSSDVQKRELYKQFLDHIIAEKPLTSLQDQLKCPQSYLVEFYKAAKVFKPLSSTMSKRFTTSSDKNSYLENEQQDKLVAALDAASKGSADQQAAKAGMFGSLTRAVSEWAPSAILCRRMNIRNPFTNITPQLSKPAPSQNNSHKQNSFTKESHSSSVEQTKLKTQTPINEIDKPSINAVTLKTDTKQLIQNITETDGVYSKPEPTDSQIPAGATTQETGSGPAQSLFTAIFGDSDDESD